MRHLHSMCDMIAAPIAEVVMKIHRYSPLASSRGEALIISETQRCSVELPFVKHPLEQILSSFGSG